jgi:alkylhydroperoxidase family enzyme
MTARIAAAQPPFTDEIANAIERTMRGRPPLVLFTTLARDPRLFGKFFAAGLLDRGNLTMRQREIVIDRTTALCGSEYEWGVHITAFGEHVQLTEEQVKSLATNGSRDECWNEDEKNLLRLCETLHNICTVEDELWAALRAKFSEEAMLELLMLAGFYRTVSYLTNALQLPLEATAARFPRAGTGCPPILAPFLT